MWRATVIIVLSVQCTSLQFLLSTSYKKKSHKKVFFLNGGRNPFFLFSIKQVFLELFPIQRFL